MEIGHKLPDYALDAGNWKIETETRSTSLRKPYQASESPLCVDFDLWTKRQFLKKKKKIYLIGLLSGSPPTTAVFFTFSHFTSIAQPKYSVIHTTQ